MAKRGESIGFPWVCRCPQTPFPGGVFVVNFVQSVRRGETVFRFFSSSCCRWENNRNIYAIRVCAQQEIIIKKKNLKNRGHTLWRFGVRLQGETMKKSAKGMKSFLRPPTGDVITGGGIGVFNPLFALVIFYYFFFNIPPISKQKLPCSCCNFWRSQLSSKQQPCTRGQFTYTIVFFFFFRRLTTLSKLVISSRVDSATHIWQSRFTLNLRCYLTVVGDLLITLQTNGFYAANITRPMTEQCCVIRNRLNGAGDVVGSKKNTPTDPRKTFPNNLAVKLRKSKIYICL